MVVGKVLQRGFTIVELLIVVVVIAILAAITIVSYAGIQEKTANTKIMSDLKAMQKLIESYKSIHGVYPDGGVGWNYSHNNPNGFIPGVAAQFNTDLPRLTKGAISINNCYIYKSDGANYKLMRLGQPAIPTTERNGVPDNMKDGYAGSDRYGYWSSGGGGF